MPSVSSAEARGRMASEEGRVTTIWKFGLGMACTTYDIDMPEGAAVVHAAQQAGQFTVWALVDSEKPRTRRTFAIYGTGWDITSPPNLRYIATLHEDPFVWHVFEVLR